MVGAHPRGRGVVRRGVVVQRDQRRCWRCRTLQGPFASKVGGGRVVGGGGWGLCTLQLSGASVSGVGRLDADGSVVGTRVHVGRLHSLQ